MSRQVSRWTWTTLDPDTKLIVSWLVSDQSMDAARDFMVDLASRLVMGAQIATDANVSYCEAIHAALGSEVRAANPQLVV